MAYPSGFEESNCVLGAPPGMEDDCDCLQVLRTADQNGLPVAISAWKLTAAELEEVNRTGRVWAVIYGNSHPPISISGVKPFESPPADGE